MANTRTGNVFYIDTASAGASDNLVEKGVRVFKAWVTSSAVTANLVLQDTGSGTPTIINIKVETDETTREFDFLPNGLYFPNGIKPSTVTDCVATLLISPPNSGPR